MAPRNVFFIGLDDFNLSKLKSIRNAAEYAFHGLLHPSEVLDTYDFPIADMLDRAEEQLRRWQESGGEIEGISSFLHYLCCSECRRSVNLFLQYTTIVL